MKKYRKAAAFLFGAALLLFISGCVKDIAEPDLSGMAPHNPTPADGAANIALPVTLAWTADQGAKYDVIMDAVNPPVKYLVKDTAVSSMSFPTAQYSSTYYWKVISYTKEGYTNPGPVWKFTVKNRFSNLPGFLLTQYYLDVTAPCFVNIMFQVTDRDKRGIADLTAADFEVLENSQAVSPTESAMNIRKKDDVPYVFKTVLMLDNSNSVNNDLGKVKEAAIALINSLTARQEIALYKFSDGPVLVQDFTPNKAALISAVNSIQRGFATTDLYGAALAGLDRWNDTYATDNIEQGALILVTDGSDTQARWTLGDVLAKRGQKRVYTIGLGNEIDPAVLEQMGNAGFYPVADVSQLNTKLSEIQADIANVAGSFYWLNYMSPKRGDRVHTLELKIKNNPHTGSDATIAGAFNSKSFYSVNAGLFIQTSSTQPYGLETLQILPADTIELSAVTYIGSKAPSYLWSTGDGSVARVVNGYQSGVSTTRIAATGTAGTTTTLTLVDAANNLSKTIPLMITAKSMPSLGLAAMYRFNSTLDDGSGNNRNATGSLHTYKPDRFGAPASALEIDVANAFVRVPPFAADSMTVSLWYYPTDKGTGSYTLLDDIALLTDNNYLIYNRASGKLGFRSGGTTYFTLQTIKPNTWNHVVVVKEKQNCKLFLNKKMVYDFSTSFNANDYPLELIGNDGARTTPGYGRYDDMRFYTRPLTEFEIQNLYREN